MELKKMRGEVHILVYCPIDTLQWGSGMDGEAFFSRGGAGRGRSLNFWSGAGRGGEPPPPRRTGGAGNPPSPRGGFPLGGASIPDRESLV